MLLKELCELGGVSGNETGVREYIIEKLKDKVDSHQVDRIGNLIVSKKGKAGNETKAFGILLCAHMDEVGLFITDITEDGFLKFQTVGGIDLQILVSKTVICGNNVPGVIGSRAVHLQKPEERKKILSLEELYVDIGASSRDEAEDVVKIGDYVTFESKFENIGSALYKAKAFDDRAGCSIAIRIFEDEYEYDCDLLGAFTVQEEVGLRGSRVVSNYIKADLAIVLEATMAGDQRETQEEDWIVEIGKGPACSLMDSATIYKPELIRKVVETAEKYNIPLQFRRGTSAANDAGNIHQAGKGIPTITLSIPCRNIHTMNSLISRNDYENCLRLVQAILKDINTWEDQ